VCLNQLGEEEKAQQIPRMGEIYRTAKEVLIWLGEDANGIATKSFSILHRIVVAGGSQKLTMEETRLLVDFFEKPWFDRRWII